MIALASHPAFESHRDPFAPMTDADSLAVGLRHIRSMDPTAVYHIVGDSTVVYYNSPHGLPGVCRLVLAPNGRHRRIDIVGFDPRTAVTS